MRLLVHGDSLRGRPRMALAACGLALRGHEVRWLGDAPPGEGADILRVTAAFTSVPDDVAIGGAGVLTRVVFAGWMAGAHAVVVDAGTGECDGAVASAVWGMFDGIRFVEPAASGSPNLDEAAGTLGRLAADTPAPPAPDEHSRIDTWDAVDAPAAPDAAHPDAERLERACERLVARRRTRGVRPAVFLDRDGTLVVEREYLSDPDDIEVLPGVPAALRALHAAGYALVVVSNQAGVGRGRFTIGGAYAAMARLRRCLRRDGVELDAVYFCPHRPEDGCPCRKPSPELLRRAARNLRLSLRDSAMVGDKALDVETGRHAGGAGVLVRTGYGRAAEATLAAAGVTPDDVADDLAAAVPWLLDRHAGEAGG